MSEIDKLGWIYIKDKSVLLARSKNKETYYIPGGKRDPGETDEQALMREIKEELSVDLIPETIAYASTFKAQADGKAKDISVKITCYFSEFLGVIKPDSEIEEVILAKFQDKQKCSLVTQMIMDWLHSHDKL